MNIERGDFLAIATKRRRKIVCLEQQYIWYIKEDYDYYDRLVLHILSCDKKLILAYPLHAQTSYVISKGRIFQNYPAAGTWKRYLLPLKEVFPVTPKFVADIILWAIKEKNAVSVVWNGKDIWL